MGALVVTRLQLAPYVVITTQLGRWVRFDLVGWWGHSCMHELGDLEETPALDPFSFPGCQCRYKCGLDVCNWQEK